MTYFTDSVELRELSKIFGIDDPNAGHEAIGDAITSRLDTMQNAIASVINHWDEFGPDFGFDERIDAARKALVPNLSRAKGDGE